MKVEKSSEARQKEMRIAALEQQLKRTRATLNSLKTRLANIQSRIQEMQQDLFSKMARLQKRFLDISQKLEQLTDKLSKDRRFNREEKSLIGELARGLVGGLQDNMPLPETDAFNRSEEEEKVRFRDVFQSFRVEPSPVEQVEIRKIYLNLSKQFHPDLARNEKDRVKYHQLQQQINEAYQTYDIQSLLELGRLFEEPQTPDASVIDLLDLKINSLENQLEFLKQQQVRLSKEIKQLRRSEMGNILTQFDSLERSGFSTDESMGIPQFTEILDLLDRLHGALEDSDRTGKLSPVLYEIMDEVMGEASMFFAMDQTLNGENAENDPDDLWDYADNGFEPNPRPKFPVGTIVRVAKKSELLYLDNLGMEHVFNLKGCSGTISSALMDIYGTPFYYLELDIASMQRLPALYIEIETDQFRQVEILDEETLAKDKIGKKEPPDKVRKVYRELLYTYGLSSMTEDRQKRLQQILLAYPAKDDEYNWLAYFEHHLPLPFAAQARGIFHSYKAKQKIMVAEYGGLSPHHGLMVFTKVGNKIDLVPLAEFRATNGGSMAQLLDDYMEWFDLMY